MFGVELGFKGLSLSARFPWRVGIVSFMSHPSIIAGEGDVVGSVRRILEDPFFDAVEVSLVPDPAWEGLKPYLNGKGVARALQPDILTKRLDLSSLDEKRRGEAVAYVKREVEVAHGRGLNTVALCSGPDPGAEKRADATEALVKSLEEVCGFALHRGVGIVFETFDRDWDKKSLAGPLDEALEMVRGIRRRYGNIGLLWDLGHAPMLGEKPEDVRRAGDVLVHVHIGCAKRVDSKLFDWHPVFYQPGAVNTVEDVAGLLRVLIEMGYKGGFAFEVKPEQGQSSEAVINTSKGVLMEAYQRALAGMLG